MIFEQLWFWMLIAAIVAIGFGIYVFEISRGTTRGVPLWSYLLIALGLVLLLIALVAAAAHYHAISEMMYVEEIRARPAVTQPNIPVNQTIWKPTVLPIEPPEEQLI